MEFKSGFSIDSLDRLYAWDKEAYKKQLGVKYADTRDNVYDLSLYDNLKGEAWVILKQVLVMCHHFERDLKEKVEHVCNVGRDPNHTLGEIVSYTFYENPEQMLFQHKRFEHVPYDIPADARRFMLMN